MAKRGLVPSPVTVLAVGDLRNRLGRSGDDYLGIDNNSFTKVRDTRSHTHSLSWRVTSLPPLLKTARNTHRFLLNSRCAMGR